METIQERASRIIRELNDRYPNAIAYDVDGAGTHFKCEIEPAEDHPKYDRKIEVIFKSAPHKHKKITQQYRIISGTLELHVEKKMVRLQMGDTYTIEPGEVHWARSDDECWVEVYSEPGYTSKDRIRTRSRRP